VHFSETQEWYQPAKYYTNANVIGASETSAPFFSGFVDGCEQGSPLWHKQFQAASLSKSGLELFESSSKKSQWVHPSTLTVQVSLIANWPDYYFEFSIIFC